MQPTLYSDDSTSSSEHLIPVVHLTVVFCCVRMSSSNGESGIWKTSVCNNWRYVRNIISPLIRHPLLRWLWVYEAGEVHSGFNGVWTTWRICDHSHRVHKICTESHVTSHKQTSHCIFWYYIFKQYLDKWLLHSCHGDSYVVPHYPWCTLLYWVQSLHKRCFQELVHFPLQSELQLPLQRQE